MQSTRVLPPLGEPDDGQPVYIVHTPGEPVPDRAPSCPPDCATCARRQP